MIEEAGHYHPVLVGAPEADLPAQRHADVFHQRGDILLACSPFDQRLEYEPQLADRNILIEQAAEDVGDLLQRRDPFRFFHYLAVVALELAGQRARLLNSSELDSPA